jgi:hypothetical protein
MAESPEHPFGKIRLEALKKSAPFFKRQDSFYIDVGRSVTAWSRLEDQLFLILLQALLIHGKLVAILFYRTPTLDGKLSLVDEIVRAVLPLRTPPNGGKEHPSVKIWMALQKDIKALLPERNAIAHDAPFSEGVSMKADEEGDLVIEHTDETKFGIRVSDLQRLRSGADRVVTEERLLHHPWEVSKLTKRLQEFSRLLPNKPLWEMEGVYAAEAEKAASVGGPTPEQGE